MIKIKKNGFTLSEMLITLSVIGLLGALVLPGLIKETTNKASITLLQSTVSNINDAVQNEIMKVRATNLKDTNFYNDKVKFLNTMDTAESGTGNSHFPPGNIYKTIDGTQITTATNSCLASAILKNGAAICMSSGTFSAGINPQVPYQPICIDINGKHGPNISGVDLFCISVIMASNPNEELHIGDVGGLRVKSDDATNYKSKCRTSTNIDSPRSCYILLEQSGFDHNYLNKTFESDDEG